MIFLVLFMSIWASTRVFEIPIGVNIKDVCQNLGYLPTSIFPSNAKTYAKILRKSGVKNAYFEDYNGRSGGYVLLDTGRVINVQREPSFDTRYILCTTALLQDSSVENAGFASVVNSERFLQDETLQTIVPAARGKIIIEKKPARTDIRRSLFLDRNSQNLKSNEEDFLLDFEDNVNESGFGTSLNNIQAYLALRRQGNPRILSLARNLDANVYDPFNSQGLVYFINNDRNLYTPEAPSRNALAIDYKAGSDPVTEEILTNYNNPNVSRTAANVLFTNNSEDEPAGFYTDYYDVYYD